MKAVFVITASMGAWALLGMIAALLCADRHAAADLLAAFFCLYVAAGFAFALIPEGPA